MLIFYLIVATVTVLLGATIAIYYNDKQVEFQIIFGFTAGIVLGFVLLLIYHLALKELHPIKIDYLTILLVWCGFLLIWLLEFITQRIQERIENQEESKKSINWGVHISLIGLSIHAIVDGFNLSVAAKDHEDGIILALGVLLHRLPVATVLTAALRTRYGISHTLMQLSPLMIAPIVGAILGERLQQGIFIEFTDYLTAFAAGTLIHVVMDGLRGGCIPSDGKMSNSTKISFVIGLILTLCTLFFIPGLGHEHAH